MKTYLALLCVVLFAVTTVVSCFPKHRFIRTDTLPAEWPVDIPIMEGYEVDAVIIGNYPEYEEFIIISAQIPESVEIAGAYFENLAGWETYSLPLVDSQSPSESGLVVYGSDGGRKFQISIHLLTLLAEDVRNPEISANGSKIDIRYTNEHTEDTLE